MPAIIEVELEKLKMPIVKVGKIDILIDGSNVLSLFLGESSSIEVSVGKHVAQAILHGVVTRKSNELVLNVEEASAIRISGKYSRIRGNIKLKHS